MKTARVYVGIYNYVAINTFIGILVRKETKKFLLPGDHRLQDNLVIFANYSNRYLIPTEIFGISRYRYCLISSTYDERVKENKKVAGLYPPHP